MEITLDGKSIKTENDVHRILAEKLNFGPHYGNNLSALWDRLTTDVERPVRLIWKDAYMSRNAMGDDGFSKVVSVFRDVEQQDREYKRSEVFVFECE